MATKKSRLKIGDVFDYLTIQEQDGKTPSNRKLWKCVCRCGNIVIIHTTKLTLRKNNSCGCKPLSIKEFDHSKYIDNKFGSIKILSYSHNVKFMKYYNFQCDCGNIGKICYNRLRNNIKCSKCSIPDNKDFYEEISGSYWCQINYGAVSRNLEIDIDREYIWSLFIKQNRKCAFTGWNIVFDKGKKQTASLDRIDSNKGYIKGNLQWVHKDINRLKNTFTNEWLLNTCKDITLHKRLLENNHG